MFSFSLLLYLLRSLKGEVGGKRRGQLGSRGSRSFDEPKVRSGHSLRTDGDSLASLFAKGESAKNHSAPHRGSEEDKRWIASRADEDSSKCQETIRMF